MINACLTKDFTQHWNSFIKSIWVFSTNVKYLPNLFKSKKQIMIFEENSYLYLFWANSMVYVKNATNSEVELVYMEL